MKEVILVICKDTESISWAKHLPAYLCTPTKMDKSIRESLPHKRVSDSENILHNTLVPSIFLPYTRPSQSSTYSPLPSPNYLHPTNKMILSYLILSLLSIELKNGLVESRNPLTMRKHTMAMAAYSVM